MAAPDVAPAPSVAAGEDATARLGPLVDALAGRRTVVLTGAGLSTDSGIPDYRGPGSPPRRPMTYQEFSRSAAARRRYWARSHVGWRQLARARPNAGHAALARLESAGAVAAVVTQNIDRLHAAAGSRRLVELHGRIDEVVCLGCGEVSARDGLDARLGALNPGWAERDVAVAPDGDALLTDVDGFVVADCLTCGGVLKPHLVFFGENVPPPRVARCYALVDEAEALLVAGSSLTVFSGRRFVKRAVDRGIPVAVVNRGPTRGDDLATVRLEGGCSELLGALARALT